MSGSIGFVGAGQMARALASGFVRAGLVSGQQVHAADPSSVACRAFAETIEAAKPSANNARVVKESDLVVLATKPQHLDSVFDDIVGAVTEQKLFVSIVAGATLRCLCDGLKTERVVRVMPNTPCMVGAGASGYCLGPAVSDEDERRVADLLSAVGIACRLSEPQMDAVTGLSGSGPAYVFQMIEALSDGGVRMGLGRDVATRLAAQTVLGAAKMVLETSEHPAALKDRVTSPGGTTIAGLHALEQGGLRAAVMNAVKAATERSAELAGD